MFRRFRLFFKDIINSKKDNFLAWEPLFEFQIKRLSVVLKTKFIILFVFTFYYPAVCPVLVSNRNLRSKAIGVDFKLKCSLFSELFAVKCGQMEVAGRSDLSVLS